MPVSFKSFAISALLCLATIRAVATTTAAEAIQPFGANSMERIVATQKGKPFVLIIWSLDCEVRRA